MVEKAATVDVHYKISRHEDGLVTVHYKGQHGWKDVCARTSTLAALGHLTRHALRNAMAMGR